MPGLKPPADRHRLRMIAELKGLEELDGVAVTVSGRQRYTVTVSHDKLRSLDFKFTWDGDHFVAKTVCGGIESQPVLALWAIFDATRFAAAYATLIELRAGRRTHGRFDRI
jgi:hypothetical protein